MRLDLVAHPSHVGVDVDGLAYPLHRPMACSHQTRRQRLLPWAILSHHYSGRWRLSGDMKPPSLDIWWRVDRLGTYVTEFYMEYIVLTKICLPYVRAIMAFGRVSLV
jgi:hypothetical protein